MEEGDSGSSSSSHCQRLAAVSGEVVSTMATVRLVTAAAAVKKLTYLQTTK